MPRGFSYHMTLNLALNSACDRWQAQRSCMTNPSFHSLAFHPPGYHAGSKSTQYCPEECCVRSIKYPSQTDEGLCTQERGVCRGKDMIWDLVRGPIQRSANWLSIFYVYVLYFVVWSAMECDVYTLGLMRCVFGLLAYLKPHCLIRRIGYTNRNWCHIVATTSRKISA